MGSYKTTKSSKGSRNHSSGQSDNYSFWDHTLWETLKSHSQLSK